MANNWQIDMIAGLDPNQSRAKINGQINKLKGQLKDISLTAKIDPKIASDIQKQLTNLQVSLTNVKISDKALNDMVSQINNALQGIKIPNINIGGSNGGNILGNNVAKLEEFRKSLSNIGMSSTDIDTVAQRIENLGVKINSLNQSLSHTSGAKGDRNLLNIEVGGIDEFGQAVKLTQTWDMDLGQLVKDVDAVSSATKRAGTSTDVFAKQQSQAVANLTNQINQLNRAANDQNAARPISDSSHLSSLSTAYNDIISAIQRMGNASSDTFITEQNNVKTLISDYKSLVSEFRNAENVSTKMKGTDLTSGLAIAKNDLEKLKADAKDFPQITQTIKDLDTAISKVGDASSLNSFNDSLRVARSELAKIKSETNASNRNEKVGINISGLQSKIADLQKISPEIDKFETEINGAKVSVQSLLSDLSKISTQSDFSVVSAKFNAFTKAAEASGIAIRDFGNVTDSIAKKANEIQLSTDLTKLETDYKKFGVFSQEVENDIKEAKKAYDSFVNAKGTDRLEAEMNSYTSALAKAKSSWKELSATQVSLSQRTSQMTSMQEWMRKNKNATKLVGNEVNKLIEECKTCDAVRFNGIKNEFKELQVQAGKAGKLGSGTLEGLIEQGKKFVQWIGVTGMVMRGIQIGKDMIQDVRELDDSLLELTKVSDLSASGLEKVTEQAYKLGERVARTGKEVIDATTEFKRAGFDMQQSMDMAESAMVMTNVAENITDTADAAGILISVLKGFNMDASETMTIVDKINQVSNTSPIGFDNIAEGLERTAGTMAQSGNTIDQTIGLITAGYAQLRNVEKVSTGLVTISARLRGVDEEGETIDGLSAKLQEDFGKIGVAIENADGSLRSIYEIAQDYSKVLPTLSDKQKQYYAELAAGKRQVTVWNAITQQFQDAEYAVNQSINSQNSALDENQKKLDSIGGHVKSFESAMEHLSSTVIESDLIKFFVDLGTTGVKAIDGLVNSLGGLGTIGLLGGAGLGIKNVGGLKKMQSLIVLNCQQ